MPHRASYLTNFVDTIDNFFDNKGKTVGKEFLAECEVARLLTNPPIQFLSLFFGFNHLLVLDHGKVQNNWSNIRQTAHLQKFTESKEGD